MFISEGRLGKWLLELESGLPVLTCRRCEVRRGPRRGVDGGIADIIASHWAEQGNLYHFRADEDIPDDSFDSRLSHPRRYFS